VVIVQGKRLLFQIVDALSASCGFTSGLNGWQQEANQNANNCDYNEKLNERERRSTRAAFRTNGIKLHVGTFKQRIGKIEEKPLTQIGD